MKFIHSIIGFIKEMNAFEWLFIREHYRIVNKILISIEADTKKLVEQHKETEKLLEDYLIKRAKLDDITALSEQAKKLNK